VLLPASLYLEEAFEALNFQHRRQFRFLLGSVFSAAAGVALSLFQARLKEDPAWFGRLHHSGLAATALLSALIFDTDMAWWGWLSAVVNLTAVILVPSHIRPDEKILAEDFLPSLNGTAGSASTAVYSKLATGAGTVKIDLEDEDDGEDDDRAALLGGTSVGASGGSHRSPGGSHRSPGGGRSPPGAPQLSDEDLEVGRINERRLHLNSKSN